MEEVLKQKNKKKEYKKKYNETLRRLHDTEYELQLIRDERDKNIGEKFLALAKLKEQAEEINYLSQRTHLLEESYVKMKVDHVNLKSGYESLKEDYEVSKKLLQLRDREIQGLVKNHENRHNKPDTPSRIKEQQKYQTIKNIRPFPSTSFNFNIMNSNRSVGNSLRED